MPGNPSFRKRYGHLLLVVLVVMVLLLLLLLSRVDGGLACAQACVRACMQEWGIERMFQSV